VGGSGGGEVEAALLCAQLLTLLHGGLSDGRLQEEMLSQLGFGAVELVAEVLPRRRELEEDLSLVLAIGSSRSRAAAAAAGGGSAGGGAALGAGDGRPHGCAVTLSSQSEKAAEKAKRKEEKRLAREAHRAEESLSGEQLRRVEETLGWLAQAGFEPAAALLSPAGEEAPRKPSAMEQLSEMRSGSAKGLVGSLPAGTTHDLHDGYVEVCVPPTKSKARGEGGAGL